jgi:hypothetical protein
MPPYSPVRGVAFLLILSLIPCCAFAQSPCENLKTQKLALATIVSAEPVAAGVFLPPGVAANSSAAAVYKTTPAFCRVVIESTPTPDSAIRIEVWMPSLGWNGKFQGVGNGGYAGDIGYGALAAGVTNGFAAASTNTGHTANGLDGSWALGHPEKIVDFGHRGIHEMTVRAKEMITAFYAKPPARSYFASCSNGGRQALMEAQRYPQDYDGIVAGAPANYWTRLFSGFAWNAQALSRPGSQITMAKLQAINKLTIRACDEIDGVKDGLIENQTVCKFAPEELLCKGEETNDCLTAPQLEAFKKIYEGPKDSKGKVVYPGYPTGIELGPGGWGSWILGPAPGKSVQAMFGAQFFMNFVHSNPAWTFQSFEIERDGKLADEKLASIMNATDPNLSAFEKRGGKLILYHGWGDPAIPATNAINYFNSVKAKMGASTDRFAQLYLVPGMQHCAGGPGPNSFNQYGTASPKDPQTDMFAALIRWVEEGKAPQSIIAEKPGDPKMTRPICPYPQISRYKGSGDINDAANFTCEAK